MTRLTQGMIEDIPLTLYQHDSYLKDRIGVGLKGLAEASVGTWGIDASMWKVAAVPITSGEGSIGSFSRSVGAIAFHVGFRSLVTQGTDVTGLQEAMGECADIVILADDLRFVALNVRNGRCAENGACTAMGYVKALELASKGVSGREVLVIGAGEVGSHAIEILVSSGAVVKVVEPDPKRAERASCRFGVEMVPGLEDGVRTHDLILNASPARIRSDWIAKGTVISSPGVPFSYDDAALAKANIIHDPLQIGTAVMLLGAATGMPADYSSPCDPLTMNNIG
jgi:3-methylornithyl-N6-L-lysine dehydrogenase